MKTLETNQISIERLDGRSDCGFLKREWSDLLERSTRPSIYASYDFVRLAIRYFSKEAKEILLLLVRDKTDDDRLLAIFPLGVWPNKKAKIKWENLNHAVSINTSDIDKPYPIIDASCELICWQALRDFLAKDPVYWDSFTYDELIPDSYLYNHATKLFKLPRYWVRMRIGPTSNIVDLNQSWHGFYKKHRNLRSKHKRIERRLGERLHFNMCSDPNKVEPNLNDYIRTEKSSWKSEYGIGVCREFYLEFLAELAKDNRLYFGFLYDGDTIISAEISYTYLDTVFFAHGAYDLDYKHFSPGTVSTSKSIQFFMDKGFKRGDFLAGYADYIEPWASLIEPTRRISIYNLKPSRVGRYSVVLISKLVNKLLRK